MALLLSWLLIPFWLLAGPSVAAQGTPAATPAESCLVLDRFPVPAGDAPHDVAPAVDGGVWYTGQGSGVLGRLDSETGEVTTVPLGDNSAPHGVIVGPDDAAWVTDGGLNAIVRVDAPTLEVTTFPLPAEGAGANLNTAVFDAAGLLWFTGQSGLVGRLDPAQGEVEIWPAPRGRGPYGITVTPEDEIYYVSLAGSYLGRIEQTGDEIALVEIDPPTPEQGARRVWSDTTGALWISEWNAGQVARYDPATETWQEWRLPGDAPQVYAVYVDERDDVWLSDFGANSLVRFDPENEEFVSLPLPDASASVRQIHGRPGEVWGAESAADALVRVTATC